jgi:hypothetical protein
MSSSLKILAASALLLVVITGAVPAPAATAPVSPTPLTIDTVKVDGKFRPYLHWINVANETGYVFERYRLQKNGTWGDFHESNQIAKDVSSKVDKPQAVSGTQKFLYHVKATGNGGSPWTPWVQVTVTN